MRPFLISMLLLLTLSSLHAGERIKHVIQQCNIVVERCNGVLCREGRLVGAAKLLEDEQEIKDELRALSDYLVGLEVPSDTSRPVVTNETIEQEIADLLAQVEKLESYLKMLAEVGNEYSVLLDLRELSKENDSAKAVATRILDEILQLRQQVQQKRAIIDTRARVSRTLGFLDSVLNQVQIINDIFSNPDRRLMAWNRGVLGALETLIKNGSLKSFHVNTRDPYSSNVEFRIVDGVLEVRGTEKFIPAEAAFFFYPHPVPKLLVHKGADPVWEGPEKWWEVRAIEGIREDDLAKFLKESSVYWDPSRDGRLVFHSFEFIEQASE